MNDDNLTLVIDTILKLVKDCSLLTTSDNKYSIYLKKESLDTISGKSYEIIIIDNKYNVYTNKKND